MCKVIDGLDIEAQKQTNLRNLKRDCTKFGIFILSFAVLRFAADFFGVLISKTDFYKNLGDMQRSLVSSGISLVFFYLIPLGICYFLFPKLSFKRNNHHYPGSEYTAVQALSKFPAAYSLSIFTNLATLGIITLICKLLGTSSPQNIVSQTIEQSSGVYITGLITTAVIPAFFEEILFRGALLGALRPYGDNAAIILSAFFFGLAHGNVFQFAYAMVLGLFFGYIYVRTNSLKITMIYHFLVNGNAVTLQYLTDRGFTFMSDKAIGENQGADGIYFVLMTSLVIAVYAVVLIGIIQIIKMLVNYIGSKRHDSYISFLINDCEGVSEAKKYAVFFTRPTVITATVLMIASFVVSLII